MSRGRIIIGVLATVLGAVVAIGSMVMGAIAPLRDLPPWFVAECAGCLICGLGLRLWIEAP